MLDRLAFHIVPTAIAKAATTVGGEDILFARSRLHGVSADDGIIAALCRTAAALGIDSPRAVLHALAAARAHAALAGRARIAEVDAATAARLVLAPRATALPPEPAAESDEVPPESPPESGPDDAGGSDDDTGSEETGPNGDTILEAAKAAIPPGLLDRLKAGERLQGIATPGRSGGGRTASVRGRPIGVRAGSLRAGERLNVLETLRAAAPWQALRRRERQLPGTPRFLVVPDDFRVGRYKPRTQTTTIFVVDASGSAAMHRLAEAKGAVELLLAECYIRRDRVALVAFRNRTADVILPPTRSLARARRNLAGLAGGGGTPLAAGIEAAAALALAVRRSGQTPSIVLLGDGRPNVRRDGSPGRPEAEAEALAAARTVGALGVAALCIDTAPRPQPYGRRLAAAMGAHYIELPRVDAAIVSQAAAALTGNRADGTGF